MSYGDSVAIVALPCESEYVNKISSEKAAHMTLLFLGDQSKNPDLDKIVEFVEFATKESLIKFYGDVDRRGPLGPDEADVLFFKKNEKEMKRLQDFRTFLLSDPHIRAAFESVDQYPEWTPHLTLGYPESPAHEDTRDYPGIQWVQFDRIAVWTGDSEGPEFPLHEKRGDLAMSDLNDILAHYGVKGMKWGVSRSREQIDADSEDVARVKTAKAKVSSNHTTDVLSNKELQDVVTRMNLEQQYKNLTSQTATISKGKKFVQGTTKAAPELGLTLARYGVSVKGLNNNPNAQLGLAIGQQIVNATKGGKKKK